MPVSCMVEHSLEQNLTQTQLELLTLGPYPSGVPVLIDSYYAGR